MFNGALNITYGDVPIVSDSNMSLPIDIKAQLNDSKNINMNDKVSAIKKVGIALRAMIGNTVLDSTQQASVDWLRKNWYFFILGLIGSFVGLYFFIKKVVKKTVKKTKYSLYK